MTRDEFNQQRSSARDRLKWYDGEEWFNFEHYLEHFGFSYAVIASLCVGFDRLACTYRRGLPRLIHGPVGVLPG